MQNMAREKGASGRDLKGEIDDLHAKGLIPIGLKEAAHLIRHFGNFGAHPQADPDLRSTASLRS
jgi:hypothetical protein